MTESLIVGVDLSSQPKDTAAVWFERAGSGSVTVRCQPGGVTNDGLREWLTHASAVIAIDAPFGWPQPFAELVRWWQGGAAAPSPVLQVAGSQAAVSELLAYRMTDRFVRKYHLKRDKQTKAQAAGWPSGLSVSTNWISYTTMRLTTVFADPEIEPIDHSGMSGPALEVYPGAALAEWGMVDGSYKPAKKKGDAKEKATDRLIDLAKKIAEHLRGVQPAIDGVDALEAQMRSSDHVADAAVAAMCAWASLVGCTYQPPGSDGVFALACPHIAQRPDWAMGFWATENEFRGALGQPAEVLARTEGWIHHPTCPPHEFLSRDPWPALTERRGE